MGVALFIGLVVLFGAAIGMQGWMIWRELSSGSRSRGVIIVRGLNIVLLVVAVGLVVYLVVR